LTRNEWLNGMGTVDCWPAWCVTMNRSLATKNTSRPLPVSDRTLQRCTGCREEDRVRRWPLVSSRKGTKRWSGVRERAPQQPGFVGVVRGAQLGVVKILNPEPAAVRVAAAGPALQRRHLHSLRRENSTAFKKSPREKRSRAWSYRLLAIKVKEIVRSCSVGHVFQRFEVVNAPSRLLQAKCLLSIT
jgi:hypothetical protein